MYLLITWPPVPFADVQLVCEEVISWLPGPCSIDWCPACLWGSYQLITWSLFHWLMSILPMRELSADYLAPCSIDRCTACMRGSYKLISWSLFHWQMYSLHEMNLSADYLVPVPLTDVQLVCEEVIIWLPGPCSIDWCPACLWGSYQLITWSLFHWLMSSLSVRNLSADYLVPVPLVDVQLVCEEVISWFPDDCLFRCTRQSCHPAVSFNKPFSFRSKNLLSTIRKKKLKILN